MTWKRTDGRWGWLFGAGVYLSIVAWGHFATELEWWGMIGVSMYWIWGEVLVVGLIWAFWLLINGEI